MAEVDFFTEKGPRLYLPDERVKQQRQINREMENLGIQIENGEGGRRSLKWRVHEDTKTTVSVVEIPGPILSPSEWARISGYRESYSIWGAKKYETDSKKKYTVIEDVFDGRDPDSKPFDTRHYIAEVVAAEEPTKYLSFREISFRQYWMEGLPYPPPALMYDDIVFHGVILGEGLASVPLSAVFDQYARKAYGDNSSAVYRMASISRVGTYPYQNIEPKSLSKQNKERLKEKTSLAFAAIQVLMAQGDRNDFYVCTLRPEFQNPILSVKNYEGETVVLDFRRTENTIALSPDWKIGLDNHSPRVRAVRAEYPGYFNNSSQSAERMRFLAKYGQLRSVDLVGPYQDLLTEAIHEPYGAKIFSDLKNLGLDPKASEFPDDTDKLIQLFTKPQNFKHLSQLLMGDGIINDRLSREEFRLEMFKTDGAPFSALLPAEEWVLSALNLMRAAVEKYDMIRPPIFPGFASE